MVFGLTFLVDWLLIGCCCFACTLLLQDFDTLQHRLNKRYRAEYQLHWCGQTLANLKNLEQAYIWAKKKYTSFHEALYNTYLEKTSSEIIPDHFQVTATLTTCSHDELPQLQALLYQQANASIPKSWPNWHYKLMEAK